MILLAVALYWEQRNHKTSHMQTEENTQQHKGEEKKESTSFFEKREMNDEINDADTAAEDAFVPIYLDDDNVLQTSEEKKEDEGINPQQNDKMEAIDIDRNETEFDKLNDAERNGDGMGE